MTKILLVEDAVEYQKMVVRALGAEYQVIAASTIAQADAYLAHETCDLILLDVGLPDGDGFSFYAKLGETTEHTHIPVIFMTAHNQPEDKIKGYELGAEDYIEKPFDLREFKVRVVARLKKAYARDPSKAASANFRKGPFEIDWNLQRGFFHDGTQRQDLSLTRIELRILMYFLQNEGVTLSRAQILKDVLGDQVHVLERTLDRHICSLREKMHEGSKYITTVFKAGYRMQLDAVPTAKHG